MNQTWVRSYLERYLNIHQCQIIERAPTHTKVKLSVEVDKDITNRPYYWAFVERTGTEPETVTMTFIFDIENSPENLRGEEIKFGNERLKQFFHSAKKRGKIVRLYQHETIENNRYQQRKTNKKLNPWLGVNYKIDYISDKKKDQIISLGIDLATGKLEDNFYPKLVKMNLSPVLPPNVVTPNPFLTFREAALQLEEYILNEINNEDFRWVLDAHERLNHEIAQIEAYYLMNDDEPEEAEQEDPEKTNEHVEKEKRIEEINWQYSPRVEVKPINYGLFYLEEGFPKMSNT